MGVRLHSKIKKVPRKYTCRCTEFTLYFLVTFSIYVVALELQDVAVMIAFMQSLLGNAIVFVFPSVFTLKMIKNQIYRQSLKKQKMQRISNYMTAKKGESSTSQNLHFIAMKILCYILILIGAVSIFGGSISAILFWAGYIE